MGICCCCGPMGKFYAKVIERLTGTASSHSDQNGNGPETSNRQIGSISGSARQRAQSGSPAVHRKKRPEAAVAPLSQKPRHHSGSRDEMRSVDRRGSGGPLNLPAYQNYVMRHSGEERLVDGPANSPSTGRIAYLEQRIRELELNQQEQAMKHQSTPVSQRHTRQYNHSSMSTSDQLRMQEMSDELMMKEKKVAQLEGKLLKAYQRIQRMSDEHDLKIKSVVFDAERARDDLTRCVDKIHQLESELEVMRLTAQNGDHTNEQNNRELLDRIWKQDRELQETRVLLNRLREKEAEFEKMRSEKGYLELKNENLSKKLEAKKKAMEDLERSVSTLRLEQTICQQSCSSGSTPLADEMESMTDIRPSVAKYTKAHSTLSNMSPLPHSKSTGLTKSFSNFALNSSKRDDTITPLMSRTLREQNRYITMCRAMVVCLKEACDRLSKGEHPDIPRILGVRMNAMSESEMEDDDEEADASKPFSMQTAESVLAKQSQKLKELDDDLNSIRLMLADWHGQLEPSAGGDSEREICRLQ
ncbi:unnamed protein product [Caenorhabditis bovis]|uniref:Uncharacterized protein n=1 Tax=Caenorhabditis bovis TaxID=2654633 RepID=A0A8S1EE37_9PELO|nr:unnamed protein product [Caenorhabditis bovis]